MDSYPERLVMPFIMESMDNMDNMDNMDDLFGEAEAGDLFGEQPNDFRQPGFNPLPPGVQLRIDELHFGGCCQWVQRLRSRSDQLSKWISER